MSFAVSANMNNLIASRDCDSQTSNVLMRHLCGDDLIYNHRIERGGNLCCV